MNGKKQIIAIGGGGFYVSTPSQLDDYVLSCAYNPKPKIAFLPTASGDAHERINLFYGCYGRKNCVPSHLSIFRGNVEHIEQYILSQDIIYVGGGNTKNMMVLWREWGIDKMLIKAYESGVIMAGVSAGSICWFEEGITDSIPGRLTTVRGLGLLKGSNCPHYNTEQERKKDYISLIDSGQLIEGIASDDDCALHYVDGQLYKVVSSRRGANAYSISKTSDGIFQITIKSDQLEEKLVTT